MLIFLKLLTDKKVLYIKFEARVIGELTFEGRFSGGNIRFLPSYLYGIFENSKTRIF